MALGFYNASNVHPIAAFTPERIAVFPDTPTMGELGHELVYWMQRSFAPPKDMDPQAVAFFTTMFETLAASPEWQADTSKKALMAGFLTEDQLQGVLPRRACKTRGPSGLDGSEFMTPHPTFYQ